MSARFGSLALAVLLIAGAAAPSAADSVAERIREGVSYRLEVLGFGTGIDLEDSALNPDNLLGLPRWQAGLDARPDLELDVRPVLLVAKPRLELRRERFEAGPREGSWRTTDSWFIQEWLARIELDPALFASFGRENLQWGPSQLLSPSNPFNRNNGRENPRVEVPGLEYARVVWLPDYRWTVSGIANTGDGRLETGRGFDRSYAVKVDYTGTERYATGIATVREESGAVVYGGYAGWTVSDAVLLHAEGRVEPGLDGAAGLVGGSYTFATGAFVVIEAFHDDAGCDAARIDACFDPFTGTAEPDDGLFRRNYLLVQVTHPRYGERTHLTARWLQNLDDGSRRVIGIVEHELGDRWEAFLIGAVDLGGREDEFGSVIGAAAMAGVSWVL